MRKTSLLIILFTIAALNLKGQRGSEPSEGVVSYITSQNVYVRFQSTQNISEGDTLFMMADGKMQPVLQVKNLSSTSCVCTSLIPGKFKVSDRIYTGRRKEAHREQITAPAEEKIAQVVLPVDIPVTDSLQKAETAVSVRKQKITGRISIASYTGIAPLSSGNSQRMRYTFSLNARNIGDSRLSAESYISFVHKDKQWSEIKANVFNGLKIYNLVLKYEPAKNVTLWAGRKINPKISNMGAVDGIQFEIKSKAFTTGVLAGSRPDYRDYSFNTSLLQYGVYLSHEHPYKNGNIQTTLAFIDQKNAGKTDRRFAYLQHSNSLIKKLSFFGTAEFNLYRYNLQIDSSLFVTDTLKVTDNAPDLSNLYLSLRYRFNSRLSLSLSYSARENIIYYETYKSIIEQLLESETQQGYLLQASYRPLKKLSVGATAGYRFRKSDKRPSKNLYAYATYSQIPWVNLSATLSATIIETSYLSGNVFALGFSRDLLHGKLSSTLTYRFSDYRFIASDFMQMQHTGELSLNWRIIRKLTCSVYYEGTFDIRHLNNRINIQLIKSF